MFKRILVGVDFTASGRDAIALASQLTDADGSISLVHVQPGGFFGLDAVDPTLAAEDRARAEQQLEQERVEAGVQAELVTAEGFTPGRVLHEQAGAREADLLVLGSCQRGVFGRAMLGNDTLAALNGAPCAVAIAPHGYAEQPNALTKIGVGYDGTPESKLALQAAKSLAASTGAEIIALSLVTLPAYSYGAIGAAVLANLDVAVEEAEKEMRSLDGVQGRAQYGLGSDLADFAEEVDLLVVGSRGYGPWGRLIHGSTSSQLARHTRGPLLILPRAVAANADAETAQPANAAVPV